MTRDEALAQARKIIKSVRENGFKNGAPDFTDAQIWQAVLDCKSANHHDVAVHLVVHTIEGRTPPSCSYIEDPKAGEGER